MSIILKQPTEGVVSSQSMDDNCGHWPKPITDFCREDRHEVIAKLAYEHWERRGRPVGSPDVDWYAAEETLREYLLASGIEIGPNGSLYS